MTYDKNKLKEVLAFLEDAKVLVEECLAGAEDKKSSKPAPVAEDADGGDVASSFLDD